MVDLQTVRAAHERIKSQVRHTPVRKSQSLAALTGASAFHLKMENFQLTGSFKVRGALNKIQSLSAAERAKGVVAASAGNHAQGVAYAARQAGVACDIFMPEEASIAKVAATKGYGARVHLKGRDYQEAFEHASRYAAEKGACYVHAFDDDAVLAGQGTIGLELLADIPNLDTVLIPIGGGGLISGIATALKGINPKIRVIGVQAAGASTIAPSLQKGSPVTLDHAETMADGIAVRKVGATTWKHIQAHVDEVVTVEEPEIAAAILHLLERAKVVAEGAGAVALAAAMHHKVDLKGRTVACLVSGGNIDLTLVNRILRQGLVKEGRVAVIEAEISDRPGSLATFLQLLGKHKASVIDLHHDRDRLDLSLNRTGVEVHVETRGPEHIAELRRVLRDANYKATINGS
ncbi:MAG: threonine ammonia-lyase [Candidatus Thermoplasmatota archaeon]